MNVKYRTDVNASVVRDTCKQRGWKRARVDWNVFWALSGKCKSLFHRENSFRLREDQFINHFPNSYVLTRKDFLPGMLKRYLREALKRGENPPQMIPATFVLPQQYVMFLSEYQAHPDTTWIMKPCCRSQGSGIFLTTKLSKLNKWKTSSNSWMSKCTADNNSYVVSRYIDKPLLIGGKKFDMRLYVLVTSYKPLKAYLFKSGFCRFSVNSYYLGNKNLKDPYMHITNNSVQRRSTRFNKSHGEKWSTENLKLYLEGTIGLDPTENLFKGIRELIVHSLKAVQMAISSNQHCFECYGYDIIIDSSLQPWLIEVNSSPSISANTNNDRILKRKLIDNVFSIILPPCGKPDIWWSKIPSDDAMNNFQRLIDEDLPPWSEEKTDKDRMMKSHLLLTKGHNSSFSHHQYQKTYFHRYVPRRRYTNSPIAVKRGSQQWTKIKRFLPARTSVLHRRLKSRK